MVGYADRTWCIAKECEFYSKDKCSRAFTKEDEEKAIKWWGSKDFPISVFVGKPTCFRNKTNV